MHQRKWRLHMLSTWVPFRSLMLPLPELDRDITVQYSTVWCGAIRVYIRHFFHTIPSFLEYCASVNAILVWNCRTSIQPYHTLIPPNSAHCGSGQCLYHCLVVLLAWALACVHTYLLRVGGGRWSYSELTMLAVCVTRLFPFHWYSWTSSGRVATTFHCRRWCRSYCVWACISGHYFICGFGGNQSN